MENNTRIGSWRDISTQYAQDDTAANSMFTLWINHGVKPDNASYFYIVSPGLSAESVAGYAQSPSVDMLNNTPELQAVCHHELGITGAAFCRPEKLVSEDMNIEVDKPCLVLVKHNGNAITVTISNPENRKATITVSLRQAEKAPVKVRFDLPEGMEAGRSVTKTARIKG